MKAKTQNKMVKNGGGGDQFWVERKNSKKLFNEFLTAALWSALKIDY